MLYWAQNNEALFDRHAAVGDRSRRLHRAARCVVRAPQLRVRRDQQPGAAPCGSSNEHVPRPSRRRRAHGRRRPMLKVEDLTVAYATDSGPVLAVDHVDFELARGRVPRDRRRVRLREVDTALRDRAAARLAATGARSSAAAFSSRAATWLLEGAAAAPPPLARPFDRDAERDERAQPGADRRRIRCDDAMRGPLEHVQEGDRGQLGEVLRLVSIDPVHLHSYPHQLSGGMRQRAMIAMALLFTPDS